MGSGKPAGKRKKGWRVQEIKDREERMEKEEQWLRDEVSLTLCKTEMEGGGCMPESVFNMEGEDVDPMRRWNILMRMHEIGKDYFSLKLSHEFAPPTCKGMRLMASIHFCLSRHMPHITDIMADIKMPFEQKKRLVRAETYNLCNCLNTWVDKKGAMHALLKHTMSSTGDIRDPLINCIVFSDTPSYFPVMEVSCFPSESIPRRIQ